MDNVSYTLSLSYAIKRKGEKKKKEMRAISMALDILSFITS